MICADTDVLLCDPRVAQRPSWGQSDWLNLDHQTKAILKNHNLYLNCKFLKSYCLTQQVGLRV